MTAAQTTDRTVIIKETTLLSSIVGERVNLRRDGHWFRGCCPFHDDSTPSFWVNDETGKFGCFGCDASGDVFDFVMESEGVGFGEALELLDRGYMPQRSTVLARSSVNRDMVPSAKRIWDAALPIEDTPAERYLERRSLPLANLPLLRNLRFARISFDRSTDLYPALVAAVQSVDGKFVGIQRTYLTEEGLKLDPHDAKRSLGEIRGNAIWIADEDISRDHVYICEGLETGLSLARMYDYGPVLVAAGAGMMRSINLPPACKFVTIGADNDAAGQRAAEEAAKVFGMRGMQTFIMTPDWRHKDWNDHVQFWAQRQSQDDDAEFGWARG